MRKLLYLYCVSVCVSHSLCMSTNRCGNRFSTSSGTPKLGIRLGVFLGSHLAGSPLILRQGLCSPSWPPIYSVNKDICELLV